LIPKKPKKPNNLNNSNSTLISSNQEENIKKKPSNESIEYSKFIYTFIEYLYNNYKSKDNLSPEKIYDLTTSIQLRINQHTILKDYELKSLLTFLKKQNSNILSRFKIKRLDLRITQIEPLNYSGVSRDFYTNIEDQLNSIFSNNNIVNYNNLNAIFKTNEFTFLDLLKILIVSKVNKNEIQIKNETIKKIIIKIIVIKSGFEKRGEREILYLLLLNDLDISFNRLSLLEDSNYYQMNNNNFMKISALNNPNINNKLNTIENKLSVNKTLETFPLEEYMNNFNSLNNQIMSAYKNIYDFFVSHFFVSELDINKIIERITVDTNRISSINQNIGNIGNIVNNIKNLFIKILRDLTMEELLLFNKCISGSYKLQEKYVFNLISDVKEDPNIFNFCFHTCFQTMDIFLKKEINFYKSTNMLTNSNIYEKCKKNFIIIIINALKSSYGVA
jgi:hypothetical protein